MSRSESSSVVKRLKGDNYQTNADLMTFTVANLRERLDTANLSGKKFEIIIMIICHE